MFPSTLLASLSLVFLAAPYINADATTMLCLVNAARAENGKDPLGLDSRMVNAASKQSNYMQSIGEMTHTGKGGSDVGDRVKEAGLQWRSVAENVANNYTSEAEALKAWMNSPGHRANLLGPYTTFGFWSGWKVYGSNFWQRWSSGQECTLLQWSGPSVKQNDTC